MLKIAYIGYGIVGRACHEQFRDSGHIIIDPKFTAVPLYTVRDLVNYTIEIAFVSINAPTLQDGSVDDSVIHSVFTDLEAISFKGIVVLKSTLPPLQVEAFAKLYPSLRYVYSPEFLRESVWQHDALNPTQIILAGAYADCRDLRNYYASSSRVKIDVKFVISAGYIEAALIKYTINSYLASKVTFMNQVYELYHDLCKISHHGNPSYDNWKENIAEILSNDSRIGQSHLQVPGPDNQYGFGGSCFSKDVKAMIGFDKNERMSVLRETELANIQHRLKGNVDNGKPL
jgi:UDP-glucose 6-dehydrogenase